MNQLASVIQISILISLNLMMSMGVAQSVKFNESISFTEENMLEVHLSCDGFLISKNCATFKRMMPVDDELRIDGTILDYTTSGELIGQTTYTRGIRNGSSKGYYDDGGLRFEGQYFNNIHTNVWKFYYPDGTLKKIIRYENGIPRLMHFTNEKGKVLVRNGTGLFNGAVIISKLSCSEYMISGNVRNGYMQGKWTVSDLHSDEIIYRESFNNGRFIEGRYENMPNSPMYYDSPKSTFVGYQLLENAYYFADIGCAEDPKFSIYGSSRNMEAEFYPEFSQKVANYLNVSPTSGRALVNIKMDSTGIKEIGIYSTLGSEIEGDIKRIITEMDRWNTDYVRETEDRFFIMILNDTEVLIPDFDRKMRSSDESVVTEIVEYEYGEYTGERKTGVWDYFDRKGELELQVDYDKPAVLFYKSDTSKYLIKDAAGVWTESYVDRPPMFLGSSKLYHDQVAAQLSYPRQALKNGITGTSLFSMEINTAGYAENLRVIDDVGGSTREVVEAALNNVENKWIPAVVDGRPVPSMLYISVTFGVGVDTNALKPYIYHFNVEQESIPNR